MDPAELSQVEVLINTIYSTGQHPDAVKIAQRELLKYQRGPNGWDLGQALLETSDANAQFLGASTFLIKIHDQTAALPDQIKHLLLQWLQSAVQTPFKPFVTRKIMGAIITLFFRQHAEWPDFLGDMAKVLSSNFSQVLVLSQMLMEDYTRLQQSIHSLRSALHKMVPQVGTWIEHSLAQNDTTLKLQALDTFLPWASAFNHDLAPLLTVVIDGLNTDDFDLFDKTAAILTDLYPVHYKAWTRDVKARLLAALEKYTSHSDEDYLIPLGRLVLVVSSEDATTRPKLMDYILSRLTENPENILDDELANDVLEFWNVFVEDIISGGMSGEYNATIYKVIGIYWQRLQLFEMSDSSWELFSSFRRDFCDFLELTYSLLGLGLFDQLVSSIVQELQTRDHAKLNWKEIEISLCCLNGLADIIGVDGKEFETVQAVFSSTLWVDLQYCKNLRVRQTAVNVIGCYDAFFESEAGRTYLSPTLTYLFSSLTEVSLQNIASRSIQKLCSSCREVLVPEYGQFLSAYIAIHSRLQPTAHQRIVMSVGYIIQAIEDLPTQADAINEILVLLEARLSQIEKVEDDLAHLRCLSGLGKALREPTDALILHAQVEAARNYWPNEPKELRKRLLCIVRQFINRPEPDLCEALCEIIKSGLSEQVETPFSFGADATISFAIDKNQLGPAVCRPSVVDLATFLITSQASAKTLNTTTAFASLSLVSGDAHDSSLRLMTEVVNKIPLAFVEYSRAAELVDFAVKSLGFSDRFVLSAASKFWMRFASTSETAPALEQFGQQLVDAIARQISGDANRSDVDYHADIVKKLMARAPMPTAIWLQHSLVDAPVSERLASQTEKSRKDFVKQLILLRGGRQTTQVIVKFWLHCRGLPEY
ncbi:hypothetical protein B9G98_02159 [Wickerhamiella sorbophila]|uniref:ARM repeat-containing protein n=1 Tax=Wickerhamiella sorbophila TaxID=45607 RepID=A0A2T0FHW8_9ASCO|nr:hypothetical protein B9G98_02159 [Wickerhamiella sorbophila]PRT54539.1 hypothetical protein B9G98_02159 [Wickerhamiella sorbophila]